MKSIFCLICQWAVARCLDDGKAPSGWAARHLTGCPGCRARHERERRVVARLSVKSGSAREFPAFLHERILANLDSGPAPRASAFPSFGHVCAVVGVAGVMALVTLQFRHDPNRDRSAAVAPVEDQTGRMTFARLPQLSGQQAVAVLGSRLDAPLEGELRFVMDDARTALSALSRNFLPTDFERC